MTRINEDKMKIITAIQTAIQHIPQWTKLPPHEYTSWISTTSRVLEHFFSDQSVAQKFILTTKEDKAQVLPYLQDLVTDINSGLFDSTGPLNEIDEAHFHLIIGRILGNFDKHIFEMYQKNVHGNGILKQADLAKIVLGNEYDVQRMLFSLIRPIFPEARVEVTNDGGYKGYRYDIFIDSYETVIETKCSRPKMTERTLTEEIGSDAYHYTAKHIYFFIYDKEKTILNVDAFCRNYSKTHDTKQLKTIVIQPVSVI